jgi:hypothetical protein
MLQEEEDGIKGGGMTIDFQLISVLLNVPELQRECVKIGRERMEVEKVSAGTSGGNKDLEIGEN